MIRLFPREGFFFPLLPVLRRPPQAGALLLGSASHPLLRGEAAFYQTVRGVLVRIEVRGLPSSDDPCQGRIFGLHIHDGVSCRDEGPEPFSEAGSHYNPHGCQHPGHAGDLPVLFGNHGFGLSLFLTDRFTVPEIVGKVLILHDMPDDFRTQPAGLSGEKIACGLIKPYFIR